MRRAMLARPSGPCHTAYMPAITASNTCAVHTLDVAFSRRMCCSRVWSAMRSAGRPAESRLPPVMRAGRIGLELSLRAEDAARQHALDLVLRGEERGMRPAVAKRHAEALRVADAHVCAPLARRRE